MPLLLRERGSGSRRVVERALKKVGLPLRSLKVAMELDSTEAIISGVEAELGVGFVSRWAIGKVLRLGTVRVVRGGGGGDFAGFQFCAAGGDGGCGDGCGVSAVCVRGAVGGEPAQSIFGGLREVRASAFS